MGAELHGAEPVQSGWRHGHHQRQDEGGDGDGGVGVATEATESAQVARRDHGRDLIHFAGRTEAK